MAIAAFGVGLRLKAGTVHGNCRVWCRLTFAEETQPRLEKPAIRGFAGRVPQLPQKVPDLDAAIAVSRSGHFSGTNLPNLQNRCGCRARGQAFFIAA